MRILFDGRVFQFQKAGGIGRYFAEVISGLPSDWEPIVAGVDDFGRSRPTHPRLSQISLPDFRPRRFRKRYQDRWWKPRLMQSVQVTHPTYYDLTSGFTYNDFKSPLVVTVYDLIHASYPDLMEGSAGTIAAQKAAINRADHIICISNSTERDLLSLFPAASGKTSVCHLASSFPIAEPARETAIFDFPTFLFVGGRGGYKNFHLLLRAFAAARTVNPFLHLHVAGSPLTFEEKWQLHFLGLSGVVTSSVYPDEAALKELYRRSVALLYPSRHEGFGLPPLEAMACGTLAVTSNTTSLPEVVGDGGIMLDATREDEWTDCILEIAKGGGSRAEMIQRGYQRVNLFSWKKVVDEHLRIYRRLS